MYMYIHVPVWSVHRSEYIYECMYMYLVVLVQSLCDSCIPIYMYVIMGYWRKLYIRSCGCVFATGVFWRVSKCCGIFWNTAHRFRSDNVVNVRWLEKCCKISVVSMQIAGQLNSLQCIR